MQVNLLHHPHLHCVVPGGGLSADGSQWIACRDGFFLSVRVLSRLFRRLFLENCSMPLMPATWSFSPCSNHSETGLHSWITWLPCAKPNGWSTPSGLSRVPSRSWTTSGAILIG